MLKHEGPRHLEPFVVSETVELRLCDRDFFRQIHILDRVEQLCSFSHRALERFASGDEARSARALVNHGGLHRIGEVIGAGSSATFLRRSMHFPNPLKAELKQHLPKTPKNRLRCRSAFAQMQSACVPGLQYDISSHNTACSILAACFARTLRPCGSTIYSSRIARDNCSAQMAMIESFCGAHKPLSIAHEAISCVVAGHSFPASMYLVTRRWSCS